MLHAEEGGSAIGGAVNMYDLKTQGHLGDEIMFESRLLEYDKAFCELGLSPLSNTRIFDAGCANGKWLDIVCKRWGANERNCAGNDVRDYIWNEWIAAHPNSKIDFVRQPTHELTLPRGSFGVVHQSMMLSSIIDTGIRHRTCEVLWDLISPGGFLISYDFWINPFNSRTHAIRMRDLQQLFPEAKLAYKRFITLAPPICRPLSRFGGSFVRELEKLRALNSHLLVALQRV
ncbi:MAG: hypothetical protein JO061_10060 [Acidobacteriaceae bacterium]|nr:hypothetical protein [Acidobacteriaceae bacterium]